MMAIVVNPIMIQDRKAWLFFSMGGYIALEEIFPSKSFAEFLTLHDPERLDKLYSLNFGQRKRNGLSRVFQRVTEYDGMLGVMVADWIQQQSVKIHAQRTWLCLSPPEGG